MVEPVVTSRFGKRPILEVPAMQVSSHGIAKVSSLQPPIVASVSNIVFPSAHYPMIEAETYNPKPGVYSTRDVPQAPVLQIEFDRKHQRMVPTGPFLNIQGRSYYYGPNGEIVIQPPTYNYQNLYPGVFNPQPGYVTIPPPAVVRVPYPKFGLISAGFNITCELDFGRVVSIDVRESEGEFRGIPEFLRTELMRTYGSYPYTEVKIKLEGGEFHIYATHENRRKQRRRRRHHHDSDSDSDSETHYDKFAPFPEWKSDVESFTSGVRPKNPGEKPRGIVRERGWNRHR